jgi:hypothetical protein
MTNESNDILDDLFHGCALMAFLEQVDATGMCPDAEATRRRAFALYETALRDQGQRNRK